MGIVYSQDDQQPTEERFIPFEGHNAHREVAFDESLLSKQDPSVALGSYLFQHIFQFLELHDLLNCCLVSRQWRYLLEDHDSFLIWKTQIMKMFGLPASKYSHCSPSKLVIGRLLKIRNDPLKLLSTLCIKFPGPHIAEILSSTRNKLSPIGLMKFFATDNTASLLDYISNICGDMKNLTPHDSMRTLVHFITPTNFSEGYLLMLAFTLVWSSENSGFLRHLASLQQQNEEQQYILALTLLFYSHRNRQLNGQRLTIPGVLESFGTFFCFERVPFLGALGMFLACFIMPTDNESIALIAGKFGSIYAKECPEVISSSFSCSLLAWSALHFPTFQNRSSTFPFDSFIRWVGVLDGNCSYDLARSIYQSNESQITREFWPI